MAAANRSADPAPLSVRAVDKGVSVSVQIANQLVAAIQAGDLVVGSRLPSEATLAKQFRVSRTSVREALSSLQFSGYVESTRGSGTVVLSTTAIGQEPLAEAGIRRSSDLIDVFEARLLLEPEVVRQGALDPVPAALRAAARMLEGMQVELAQQAHDHSSDLGLHRALIRSCRNRVLVEQAEGLLDRTEGSLWRRIRDRAWTDDQLLKIWLSHHIAMADAVTRRDGDGARDACREHLQSVLEHAGDQIRLSSRDRGRLVALLGGF